MSFWDYFVILLVLLVHCLLVLFLFGIVLHALLVGPLLGGCLCLVRLLDWLLLTLGLLRMIVSRVCVTRFTGLVVLVRDGKEST